MALRVLLADESTTIKKVFQLALQDYGVEVQTVNIGMDVVPVSAKFQPDIVFADVLLQKKSGYEVCQEIKATQGMETLPVVLMWSGFMEIDEDKFEACGADSHLEKPFDVDQLRKLINAFVPKTADQNLSQYLRFPKMPDLVEEFGEASGKLASPMPQAPAPNIDGFETPSSSDSYQPIQEETEEHSIEALQPSHSEELPDLKPHIDTYQNTNDEQDWSMESFEPINHFESDDSEPIEEPETDQDQELLLEDDNSDENDWSEGQISEFKLNTKVQDEGEILGDIELEDDEKFEASMDEDIDLEAPIEPESPKARPEALNLPSLSEAQLEKIIRAQSKEVIESVVWKVVPEIATQMIEREIKRLLSEPKI